MKYNIELSKEQMIVIAQSLEDISRFASGQWEMRYTIVYQLALREQEYTVRLLSSWDLR
jgi:hypothetical protein